MKTGATGALLYRPMDEIRWRIDHKIMTVGKKKPSDRRLAHFFLLLVRLSSFLGAPFLPSFSPSSLVEPLVLCFQLNANGASWTLKRDAVAGSGDFLMVNFFFFLGKRSFFFCLANLASGKRIFLLRKSEEVLMKDMGCYVEEEQEQSEGKEEGGREKNVQFRPESRDLRCHFCLV